MNSGDDSSTSGFARALKDQYPAMLGRVSLDTGPISNRIVHVDCPGTAQSLFRREVYVGITDQEKSLDFFGRIVSGPFFERASHDDNGAETDVGEWAFRIHGGIEIMGQIEGTAVIPVQTRPEPGSIVYVFPEGMLRSVLQVEGDMCLGHLIGQRTVRVEGASDDKSFLPRNVGIFGTVGSGKSNTAQVIAEEAVESGWAVVVIDVEGEYVRMNEATEDQKLTQILKDDYALGPTSVNDFHVYVPSSGFSDAVAPARFKVPVSQLDPDMVGDILDFSPAESRVYGKVTSQAAREHAPIDDDDEYQRPFTLQHLVDGLIEGPSYDGNPTLRLMPLANQNDVATASQLRSKLLHLGRSEMMDWNRTTGVPELPVDELLVPGRISVLDVSETDNASRNLGISYLLQEVFQRVVRTPKGQAMPNGRPRPPVVVIIEEVHTFVSRSNVHRMRSVLDALQVITRRGRKRWMSLVLVSQQPNHVPDEIFELANTRFLHQVKSESNLKPIRETTGGVEDALWSNVPALGPGQCLLTGPVVHSPIFVSVRPARSKRLLVT